MTKDKVVRFPSEQQRELDAMKYTLGALSISTRGRHLLYGIVPRWLPDDEVLAHNQGAHTTRTTSGEDKFTAWFQKSTRGLELCDCGWSGLQHYRVKLSRGERAAFGHLSLTTTELEFARRMLRTRRARRKRKQKV